MSDTPILCFAAPADWPAVQSVLRLQPAYEGVQDAVTEIVKHGRSIKRPFPEPTHVLVEFASAAQRDAGHARAVLSFTTDPHDTEPDCPLTITSLYVRKEARRTGIGRRMVDRVIKLANKQSVHSINIMAEVSACPFWESIGFLRMPIPTVCDTVNMCMPLKAALGCVSTD
jgi:GNAT superfamily N-acetyltransferase